MEDIITKLVEIDEKAKAFGDETKKQKEAIESEIVAETERIHDKYMADAKKTVETEKKEIEDKAAESFHRNEAKRDKSISDLKSNFDKNVDSWVERIVSEVLA